MGGDGHSRYYRTVDDFKRSVHHHTHPFGLSLPNDNFFHGRELTFVGDHATDMSVEAFCATLRFWLGYTEEQRVTKLRVIRTRFPDGEHGQHHVFFEVWLGNSQAFMSGETTDFSGAGKHAMNELQGIFEVLSFVYGVQIETHTFDFEADLSALYSRPQEVCV